MNQRLKLYSSLYRLGCILGIVVLLLLSVYHFSRVVVIKETKQASRKIILQISKNNDDFYKETSLSLLMVGDCLIHSAIYDDAKLEFGYNFEPILENLSPYINKFDLAFYNQESILGGNEIGLSTYPRFNSPYEVGDAFRNAGFNLVSLANNHTLDRGEQAIINSKNYWNKYPEVMASGSYASQEERNNIPIYEMNGISYALLSYTDSTNGLNPPVGKEYLVNRYNEEQVRRDIENVRDKVDVLLVSMHFGEEYTHIPTERQREIASYLASLNVDIVIGHHPHVIQPVEMIDNTLVVYSLGNFISAQRGVDKLTGLMLSLDIKKITNNRGISIYFENINAELVYTSSNSTNGYRNNFKLYNYKDLNEQILPNYLQYQDKYSSIVGLKNLNIETR